MYLSAQRTAFGASTPVSVSSDIPLIIQWRMKILLEVHLPGRGLGKAIVKGTLNCIIPFSKNF